MKQNKNNRIEKEDATKYGEFIPSYFDWITLDKQKEITKRLENMTNKEKTEE